MLYIIPVPLQQGLKGSQKLPVLSEKETEYGLPMGSRGPVNRYDC